MKNLFIFISHFYNDDVKKLFDKIKNSLDENTDIYFALSNEFKGDYPKDLDILLYSNKLVTQNSNYLNPFKPIEKMVTNGLNQIDFNKYDYIYFNEYDVYYTGNVNDLINELNSCDADLLCTYIKKFKFGENTPWMWSNEYFKNNPNNPEGFEYILKSCLSFVRISSKAFQFVSNYNSNIINDSIYELYYPTLLYNNGFKIKSLSSNINEDDEEFNEFKITTPEIYYCNVSYDNIDDMINHCDKHFDRPMLYTRYKIGDKKKKYDETKYFYSITDDNMGDVDISVLMPVYNSEKYLISSLSSLITQENFNNFEIIIVNDGSTDNSELIIKEFLKKEKRIRYITKKHSGLVDTLNIGYKYCKGKYIVRMDSDDICYRDRLRYQFDWMESHPEADLCSGSMEWGNGKVPAEYCILGNRELTLNDLLNANQIAHPCVIWRKSSMDKMPYLYENYYKYAEDYKLWCSCLQHGLRLFTDSKVVLWYRQENNKEQITKLFESEMFNMTDRIKRAFTPVNINNMDNRLTAILTFKNELDEVERTVINLRANSKNLPIIMINDGSTDPTDYEWVAKKFNCEYYYNETSLGVAGSRDFAVSKVKTPYFVLLDAHMRFYDEDWVDQVVEKLELYPNSIITSQSVTIWKNKEDIYEHEELIDKDYKMCNHGAYVNMDEPGHEYTAKWTHRTFSDKFEDNEIIPIACVLGAFYACSTRWWNYIHGLKGLLVYGQDEPLMSIKTWLMGGSVLLMRNFYTGHLYRDKHPYPVPAGRVYSNSVFLNHLFAENEDKAKEYDESLRKRLGDTCYEESYKLFNDNIDLYEEEKRNLEEHKIKDITWFYNFNDKCYFKTDEKNK